MGNSASLEKQVQKSEDINMTDDMANEEKAADFIFEETDDIMSLPIIDEPIRIKNNTTFLDTDERKKNSIDEHNKRLEELEPVENKAIKLISDKVNLIIDEFDFYTLIVMFQNTLLVIF